MKHRSLLTLVMQLLATHCLPAFSLLGPPSDRHTPDIGSRLHPHETGAPLLLGEEYRWNLPVVTYGFDPAFEAWFGSNGVAEVMGAIATFNILPSADNLDLNNYPATVRDFENSAATSTGITDLRSYATAAILEVLGLTNPRRNTWKLTFGDPAIAVGGPGIPPGLFLMELRNYDPTTWEPTNRVNTTSYSASVISFDSPIDFWGAVETPLDALTDLDSTSAGLATPDGAHSTPQSGQIVHRLSRDDVGRLRYLLATANANVEVLPPDITDENGGTNFVNLALRPGVNRIRFQRMPYDTTLSMFPAVTNVMDDRLFQGGTIVTQRIQRVCTRPDIVFSAAEWINAGGGFDPVRIRFGVRTNLSSFNAAFETDGPGVIFPGCVITFNKTSPHFFNQRPYHLDENSHSGRGWTWGAIINPSTVTTLFPEPAAGATPLSISTWLSYAPATADPELRWRIVGQADTPFRVDWSTNLTDWHLDRVITGRSAIMDLQLPVVPDNTARYYRILAE